MAKRRNQNNGLPPLGQRAFGGPGGVQFGPGPRRISFRSELKTARIASKLIVGEARAARKVGGAVGRGAVAGAKRTRGAAGAVGGLVRRGLGAFKRKPTAFKRPKGGIFGPKGPKPPTKAVVFKKNGGNS